MFLTGLEELVEKVAMSATQLQGSVNRMQDRWGGQHPKFSPASAPMPPTASAKPSLLGRIGRGAALPAALIGGGLAYGALQQNENDAQKMRQVYAPMTGSIYG